MRFKTDFVTNSSSSAFIVGFPKRIKTQDNVRPYIESHKVATVFADAIKQRPYIAKPTGIRVFDLICGLIVTGYFEGIPSWSDESEKYRKERLLTKNEFWKHGHMVDFDKKHKENCRNAAMPYAREFVEKANGHYIYTFNYGDEDGEFGSDMEHGNTFGALPHLIISHH